MLQPRAVRGCIRAVSFCLAFLLLLSVTTVLVPRAEALGTPKYGTNYNLNVTLTGDPAKDIVAVGKAQKGKSGTALGLTKWCDAFVLDCARMANVPTSVIPNVRGCKGLYDAILKAGGVKTTKPVAGDIVLYHCKICKSYPHIGIYCGSSVVCEGNISNKVVVSNRNSLFYNDTKGHSSKSDVEMLYVHPNYSTQPKIQTTFTVRFDPNGGKGSMPDMVMTYGVSKKLPPVTFTRDGYQFAGWNVYRSSDQIWSYTNGSSSGVYREGSQPAGYYKTVYPDQHTISRTSSVDKDLCIFYAVWTKMSSEIRLDSFQWYPTTLSTGSAFTTSGLISSNYPLTNVTVKVTDSSGAAKFTASAAPNSTSYEIYNLDSKMKFKSLTAGTYHFIVSASNKYGSKTLADKTFTVKGSFTVTASNLKYPQKLTYGDNFKIGGTVTGSSNIASITASISNTAGEVLTKTKASPNAKTYNIANLASELQFSTLPVGTYLYRLDVKDGNGCSSYPVTIHFVVEKAAAAPDRPAAEVTVSYAASIGELTSALGSWILDEDSQMADLPEGEPVTLTAVYNGIDQGNYANESMQITVIRQPCTHTDLYLDEVQAATDFLPGFTGNQYCADCGALIEAGTEIAPLALSGSGSPFRDVAASGYYYLPVLWALDSGITSGTTKTTFSPGNGCTRAQVVTFLWRAAGNPEPADPSLPFTDVKPDAYFAKAVAWAVEKGITVGTSKTAFSPDRVCTRGQIVTFLWRSQDQPSPESIEMPFTDVKDTAYYRSAVQWAVENGITAGTSPTAFSPDASCTRAQIVTFLYRNMALESQIQDTES